LLKALHIIACSFKGSTQLPGSYFLSELPYLSHPFLDFASTESREAFHYPFVFIHVGDELKLIQYVNHILISSSIALIIGFSIFFDKVNSKNKLKLHNMSYLFILNINNATLVCIKPSEFVRQRFDHCTTLDEIIKIYCVFVVSVKCPDHGLAELHRPVKIQQESVLTLRLPQWF
jgi:hypothetical protein